MAVATTMISYGGFLGACGWYGAHTSGAMHSLYAGVGSGAWRRRTAAATAAGGGAGVDVALRQQRCDGVRLQQNMIKVAGRPRNPLGQP